MEPKDQDDRRAGRRSGPNPWRYAGMGTELVAGIAGCILVGYWIDSKFDTGRAGVIVGAIVGCVGGFYHFLRQAVKLAKESEEARQGQKVSRGDDKRL